MAAGIALMALAATGAYQFRAPIANTASMIVARVFEERAADAAERARETARTRAAASIQVASAITSASSSIVSGSSVTIDSSGALLDESMLDATALASNRQLLATSADSIVWTPAVARTWVNVRNDASRGGNVVGVINPSSRALLGTTRSGWRQVKSTEVTGWVDPRLFEADSTRTRGL